MIGLVILVAMAVGLMFAASKSPDITMRESPEMWLAAEKTGRRNARRAERRGDECSAVELNKAADDAREKAEELRAS